MSESSFVSGPFVGRKQLQFRRFEEWGEDKVRAGLSSGRFQGQQADLAREWLSRFDEEIEEEKERRRDQISEDTLSEARRANDIAVRAIAKATTANTIAAIASIIAIAAIAVSIAMPFILKHFGINP